MFQNVRSTHFTGYGAKIYYLPTGNKSRNIFKLPISNKPNIFISSHSKKNQICAAKELNLRDSNNYGTFLTSICIVSFITKFVDIAGSKLNYLLGYVD